MTDVQQFTQKIIENVQKVIIGKHETIELLLVALLCEGHVLIEDVPGTGKTMMARSMAISLGGQFKRIQCTPDLLPNDITGVSIFNQQSNEFEFRPGPVFVNILLADEINRATPRTQAALLEAMQEQQVTVDGITRLLPRPFLVMATQNPVEYEGTFPLPEAQLDRFLLRLPVGYPSPQDEKQILVNLRYDHPINTLKQVEFPSLHDPEDDGKVISGIDEINRLQKSVWEIHIDQSLQDYIIELVGKTRTHPDLALGASPRASLALYKASQAYASIRGRDYVVPDDIKTLIPFVLPHRLILKPEAELRGRTAFSVISALLENTPLELGTNSLRTS
jgi:MoxR-like ATPase